MMYFKKPRRWHVPGREEYKFHTDIVIEKEEELVVIVRRGDKNIELCRVTTDPSLGYTKMHIELAWEHDTEPIKTAKYG